MGKLTVFEMFVNTPEEGCIKAGNAFSGEVLLEISDAIEVNEIRVALIGRSHVQWAQAEKSSPMAEIQTSVIDPVMAEESYIDDEIRLFPARARNNQHHDPNKPVLLKKGCHTFPFQLSIPASAPSSFSCSHGYVRYLLKAKVERPWKVEVNTRTLTVVSDLDLNLRPAARECVELLDSMNVTNFPLFSTGECRATMRLAKKGYLAGETIPVELAIHNDSHHELHKAILQLKMVIQYKAINRVCTSELLLAKSRLGRIPAGRTFEGFDRKLTVPKGCPPSGLPGCHLITVKYYLELKIKPSLLSLKRLKLTTDVIIGTIPLDTTFFDSPPDYYSCCPPSYEDVIDMTKLEKYASKDSLGPVHPPFSLPATSPIPTPTPIFVATSATTATTAVANAAISTNEDAADHRPPLRRLLSRQPSYTGTGDVQNDDLRLSVLKESILPESSDEAGPMRPRANTGNLTQMLRARGR